MVTPTKLSVLRDQAIAKTNDYEEGGHLAKWGAQAPSEGGLDTQPQPPAALQEQGPTFYHIAAFFNERFKLELFSVLTFNISSLIVHYSICFSCDFFIEIEVIGHKIHHLKYTVQRILVYLESCATITTI